MKHKLESFGIFFLLIIIILFWTILFYFYSPEEIVYQIGVNDGYLVLFFSAALGGVSTITASSFYATVFTFTSGGLNPLLVGVIGGAGITIGDSFFYYLGYRGRNIVSRKLNSYLEKISNWLNDNEKWRVQLFIFLYSGFTPFPNDLMTIPLGLNKYKYKNIFFPLLIGNICAITLFALGSYYIPGAI
mgnify:CR=1 FL=1